MSEASVLAVTSGSPAMLAGVLAGDLILSVNGLPVRDVIQYRRLTDDAEVHLELLRGSESLNVEIVKSPAEPLGLEIGSALFDAVRTCDNHCPFCFIHQLPPGMRRSLTLKDDDYRLSFLYGNFTTLTRFTESDVERVITEGLSPLFVSIHSTDPELRSYLLRNRRGATSLRWLRVLLDHGVEVHGQIVVCPGINDGDRLDETLLGVLVDYPELADVAVVPLGVSRHNHEPYMRPHTTAEAVAVVEVVERWQHRFAELCGRPLVFAADEYYLLAGRPFPPRELYGDFAMHEDGIGMARAFEAEFRGDTAGEAVGVQPGFFAWVDGAPAEGYRAPRGEVTTEIPGSAAVARAVPVSIGTRPAAPVPVAVVTSVLGAAVIGPLLTDDQFSHVRVLPVENRFFGGNVGVTGLLVGEDLAAALAQEPAGHRYVLPDVCLSGGRFLDGLTPADLPHPVEVIPTDGIALRRALSG
jgi:putative radical SAM enzyme (TIGR03279 family)